MSHRARHRGYSRMGAPSMMEMGNHSPNPEKCVVNKKFWVGKDRRLRVTSLPSAAYTIFLRNPIAISWWLLLIVEAWVLLFVLLQQFGLLILPAIDNTVPAIVFGAVTFLSGFILNGGLSRRGNNIRNYKSLISAAVNTMSGIQANLKIDAWIGDPKVKIEYHNNAEFFQEEKGVMKVLEEISELLGALLAAQRNVLRGGFNVKRLPLDAPIIAALKSQHDRTPTPDVLVSMQTEIWYRINKIAEVGGFIMDEDTMYKRFNKDLVDSLGNVAIDSSAKTPLVFQVFYYFFLALWIIYMPFWLIPLYSGFFVLIAAPLSIVFFTATVELGNRMPDIFVTSSENTYSGYNLVQEMREGAANVDSIYMGIFNRVRDLKAGPLPLMGKKKPPAKEEKGEVTTQPAPTPTPAPTPAPAPEEETVAPSAFMFGGARQSIFH